MSPAAGAAPKLPEKPPVFAILFPSGKTTGVVYGPTVSANLPVPDITKKLDFPGWKRASKICQIKVR
jgi:hypothetical protein